VFEGNTKLQSNKQDGGWERSHERSLRGGTCRGFKNHHKLGIEGKDAVNFYKEGETDGQEKGRGGARTYRGQIPQKRIQLGNAPESEGKEQKRKGRLRTSKRSRVNPYNDLQFKEEIKE